MQDSLDGLNVLWPVVFAGSKTIVTALIILVAGWWISSLLGRWVRRAAQRASKLDGTVLPMLQSTIEWAIRIFTIIAVLAQFGVQTASLITALGAAGLAIGLALQGTLQNIAAGIMLLILRPIRVGETVALSSGSEGVVDEVGLFLTRLVKADGVHITLPNSVVWNATITNFSRNSTRRLEIPVGIRYGDDLSRAIEVAGDIVKSSPRVLSDPAPTVNVSEYRDHVVVLTVLAWAEASQFGNMKADLYQELRLALDAAGFNSPAPMYAIRAN